MNKIIRDQQNYPGDVFEGDNSIICANTIIHENVKIGSNTIIGPLCCIESGAMIGDNVTLQPFCVIARNTIIQDNVFIGPHFSCANDRFISEGEHGTSKNKKSFKSYNIVIKKGARIGSSCVIAPGVTIGENCFIKMNCFVKKDVPDGTVVHANTTWPDDYEF